LVNISHSLSRTEKQRKEALAESRPLSAETHVNTNSGTAEDQSGVIAH